MFQINSPLFSIFKSQLSVFRDTACLHWFGLWSACYYQATPHILLRLFLFISALSQEMIVICYSLYFYFEVLVHLVNNDTPQFIPLTILGQNVTISLFFYSLLHPFFQSLEIILMYWMNILLVFMCFKYLLIPWTPMIKIYMNGFVPHTSRCLLMFSLHAVFLISIQGIMHRSSPLPF